MENADMQIYKNTSVYLEDQHEDAAQVKKKYVNSNQCEFETDNLEYALPGTKATPYQIFQLTENKTTLLKYFGKAFDNMGFDEKLLHLFEEWLQKESDKDVNAVKHFLKVEYEAKNNEGKQRFYNLTHAAWILHSIICNNLTSCQMPHCKELKNALYNLRQEEKFEEILFDKWFDLHGQAESIALHRKGVDFEILHGLNIGSGTFGKVFYSTFIDLHSNNKMKGIIKKIDLNKKKAYEYLKRSVPNFHKLRDCRNVLVPEMVLRGDKQCIIIMKKGDLSLHEFVKYRKKESGEGLTINETTFYIQQMVAGIYQIHCLGLTHGDPKLSNCVLMEDGKMLKFIDLDTVKRKEERAPSGTLGYASSDVQNYGNVRQKDDVHSIVSCIPVLLYGLENILFWERAQIIRYLENKDKYLASIYVHGTLSFSERLSTDALHEWFEKCPVLRKRISSFQPSLPEGFISKNFAENKLWGFLESSLAKGVKAGRKIHLASRQSH